MSPPSKGFVRNKPPVTQMALDKLVVNPALAALFPNPDPEVERGIAASIADDGYDRTRPIDAWRNGAGPGRHVIVEGHTRYRAARANGQQTITTCLRQFASFEDALMFAAREQRLRRSLNIEQFVVAMIRAIEQAGRGAEESAEGLATRLSCGIATVNRARSLVRRGNEQEVGSVLSGGSLKVAYEGLKQREKRETEEAVEPVDHEPEPDQEPIAVPDDHDDTESPSPPRIVVVRERLNEVGETLDVLHELTESDLTTEAAVQAGTHREPYDELVARVAAVGKAFADLAGKDENR